MVIAPMSGVTDEATRLIFLKYGKPDVFWTEFVSVDGLFSRGRDYCLNILKHSKKERPIVAQIFGGNPENFTKAALLISKMGFDGIDINMGCPNSNIEKQGGGASLIKNPLLAKEIIRATLRGAQCKNKKIPVSVKTRIGYSKNEINQWIPCLLEEGISALTVHFRTRQEGYNVPAHWEQAKEIIKIRNKLSPKTLLLGNGDVGSLNKAKKLVKETGFDGVMVGRGVLGNPWFFTGKTPPLSEKLKVIVEHAKIVEKNNAHFEVIKKHFHAYAKNFKGAKDLREALMKVKNSKETEKLVQDFVKG